MPRIPDVDSLGARPTPRFQRSVASARNAGAVAEAAGQFGETVTRIGREVQEKEDRLAYAAAKTSLLRADMAARQELENDPDYESWEAKYSERMTAARAQASGMIRSRSDRSLFEADTELDIARGSAAVASAAGGRRRDARVAMLDEGLAGLEDVGQSAPDDATREAALNNASELIRGAVERGDITAVDGVSRRQRFAQNHTVARIETMLLADDFDGAAALLERSRGRIDPSAEANLRRQIDNGLDNRNALTRAEEAVHGASSTQAAGAPEQVAAAGHAGSVAAELHRAGYSSAVVAGFLGNFDVEGGYSGAQGDGGSASGIAQWRHERRTNFKRKFGIEPHQATAAEQAQFVVWEMQNPEAAGMTVAQRDAILAADTPEKAAALIDQHYERSSGEHRARREQAARGHYGGTTQAAQRHNLGDVLNSIDARAAAEGWTPEETEAAKTQATRIVQRDESLLQRQYSEAGDEAAQVIASLPDGLTNINQIPKRVRDQMDPTDVAKLEQNIRDRARERAEDAREDAQARRATELAFMARFEPDRFKGLNPLGEAARLSPQQYNAFMMDYLEANEDKPFDPSGVRGGINEEINFQLRHGGLEFDDSEKVALFDYMEAQLGLVHETKGRLENSDYSAAFQSAMRTIPNTSKGWFGTGDDRRAFEVFDVPAAAEAEIVRNWRGSAPPTPGQIKAVYARMLREGD